MRVKAEVLPKKNVLGVLKCPKCGSKGPFVLGYYDIGCCYCGADMWLICGNCGETLFTFRKCKGDFYDITEITEKP